MDLHHEFVVEVPISEAWATLTDVERIAPCLPGAQLTEVEGDVYRGQVKVKVGPILAQFKGQASFASLDEAARVAVLKAEGRDTTGKGNAAATITARLTEVTPSSTKCVVDTDLSISGKVAQFGRGALADVSDRLLAQFVDNLNTLIASGPAPEAPPAPTSDGVRTIDSPEAAPLDLLGTAGAPILKRVLPVIVIVAVLVAIGLLVL